MNTKLFISEQLRKIFTSAELLEKNPYSNGQTMHSIILKQLQCESTPKPKPNTFKIVWVLPRIDCAHDSTACSLVPQ